MQLIAFETFFLASSLTVHPSFKNSKTKSLFAKKISLCIFSKTFSKTIILSPFIFYSIWLEISIKR